MDKTTVRVSRPHATIADVRNQFKQRYPTIKYIAGKWFVKDEEVKLDALIRDEMIANPRSQLVHYYNQHNGSWKAIEDDLRLFFESHELWPSPKAVRKARDELDEGFVVDQRFVNTIMKTSRLDEKQLRILNILLWHPEEPVAFITTGVGGSGKSTYLNLVKQLFDNDVSSTSLLDLTNPYILAEAVTCKLICNDDIGSDEVNSAIFKLLASKQCLTLNHKFGSVERNFHSQSALFWCCNKAPRLDILDSGLVRRIVFYERNTVIQNPDKSLLNKQYDVDELSDIALAASYYDKDFDHWKDWFIDETHKYLVRDNSVYMYHTSKSATIPLCCEYADYKQWCNDNGYKAYSHVRYDDVKELLQQWMVLS